MASHLSVATHFAHDAEANTCKPFFVKWISISIQLTNRLMGWCCCYLYRIAYSIQKRTKVEALTISFLATQMRSFFQWKFFRSRIFAWPNHYGTHWATKKVCHRRKSCSSLCSFQDLCIAGIFVRISLICLSTFVGTVLVGDVVRIVFLWEIHCISFFADRRFATISWGSLCVGRLSPAKGRFSWATVHVTWSH